MNAQNPMQASPANLARAPFSLDAEALAWVASTRDALSTEQKVRQLFNLACHGDDPAQIEQLASLKVGGITRFGGTSLEQSWQGTRTLIERSEIPLLISGDIEGGAIGNPFATRITNQLGLAAAGSAALSEEAVNVLAAEARALGYNWTFTPVLDINAAFRSAIVATRSYGSDVDTIIEQALVNVRTFQRHGIAATGKHWPGEGFDDRDQHLVTTINPLDMDAWRLRFGRIYQTLIDAGVLTVMSAHIALPAYARQHGAAGLELYRPASVSRFLNMDLLRGELGFNGLIVSDASAMAGLSSWAERAECVPELISSGCDVLLFPSPFETDFANVMKALSDGRITEARLEDAVTRVLGLKAALGLHRQSADELIPPLAESRRTVRHATHLDVEARTASAAITLVKDAHQTLPLDLQRHRRIVVLTDPERSGFAGQPAMPLVVQQLLGERGFDVRAFDAANPPTPANTDLVLYLLAQESLLVHSHIYLDWARVHGDWRGGMRRYWHDLPCALVSFGHPYYLYDAPRMPCVINAYTAIEPVQHALVRKLLGEEPFTGQQPVDAFCGLPDARF
jgi:beta-N-acetylhexosaminidase